MTHINRQNNFDLVRLIAALQVVAYHSLIHFNINTPVTEAIKHFPGVPVFFALSGFLITMSYQNNRGNLKKYFYNRFLRIYPALWVCFAVTVALLFGFKVLHLSDLVKADFWIWVLCQMSFFQFYDNALVQRWGIGSPNGSLWSICVELQFYVVVPVLFWLLSKIKKQVWTYLLFIGFFVSSVFFEKMVLQTTWWFCLNVEGTPKIFLQYDLMSKASAMTIIYNFYYFMFGILFCLHYDKLVKFVQGKLWWWAVMYLLYVLVFYYGFEAYGLVNDKSILGIISCMLLVGMAFSAAFTNEGLSQKLLKGNDISYGVYIYHMLMINSMYGYINGWGALTVTLMITIVCAYVSWKLVEKPILSLKNKI